MRYTAEPMADDASRFVAKSVLRLRVQKHHHNTTLLCQSQNAADRHFKTAEVRLEVRYAPKMKLVLAAAAPAAAAKATVPASGSAELDDDVDSDEDGAAGGPAERSAVEGHEARFLCVADANPGDITYKWFVNNELVVGDYTTEMVSASNKHTHTHLDRHRSAARAREQM